MTTATRPPASSTSEAQSVAARRSPANARAEGRRQEGLRRLRKATNSSRSSVSTTTPVHALDRVRDGDDRHDAVELVRERREEALDDHVVEESRAASWTSTTRASSGTSASAARTESALAAPPVTHETTFVAATPQQGESPAPPTRPAPQRLWRRPRGSGRDDRDSPRGAVSPKDANAPGPTSRGARRRLQPRATPRWPRQRRNRPGGSCTRGGRLGLRFRTLISGWPARDSTSSSHAAAFLLVHVLRVHELRGRGSSSP